VDARELDRLYLDHVASLERRYAGVLESLGWDAVVIDSGSPVKRTEFDDQYWPLRPMPHWQHWVSLSEADAALVVRPGRRPTLVRACATSFWEKPSPPESEAFFEAFDVVSIDDPSDAKQHFGGGSVAFAGELRGRVSGWASDAASINPTSLIQALDALRTLKTHYEVACIAEANRRAKLGHDALRDAFRNADGSELDLHLLYLKATAQDDAETPYKNIVALGSSAATLHHIAYARQARRGPPESLLVDAGAMCRGYGSDITRTWIRGTGHAADVFDGLVAGLDAMQKRLCARVRVGQPYEDLHDESHRQVAAVLRDVGLVRGSVEEAIATGVTRAFYPHGLGHSLGLQTHDVGCALRKPRETNGFLRNTSDIAVGQVFTIEPGIYFIESLLEGLRAQPAGAIVDWKAVEVLAPFGGARIEDDVHVIGGEAILRNLTREHLPIGGGRG
jgi:Xaa-Pro dipeptidase